MKEISDSRIAVVGVGGVGGYVGGMLANHYPHVTFVARGARGESIREKGHVLHLSFTAITRERSLPGRKRSSVPQQSSVRRISYLSASKTILWKKSARS